MKVSDFQDDKPAVRDGKVPSMPGDAVNNISLLKSKDRQPAYSVP